MRAGCRMNRSTADSSRLPSFICRQEVITEWTCSSLVCLDQYKKLFKKKLSLLPWAELKMNMKKITFLNNKKKKPTTSMFKDTSRSEQQRGLVFSCWIPRVRWCGGSSQNSRQGFKKKQPVLKKYFRRTNGGGEKALFNFFIFLK